MPKFEPVRWYLIVSAVLAIVAYYVDIPVELFVGLAAAWFGVGGEVVRAHTIPTARFEDPADHDDEVVNGWLGENVVFHAEDLEPEDVKRAIEDSDDGRFLA